MGSRKADHTRCRSTWQAKCCHAVEGIKTLLEPYGVPLVNEYALKATAQQQVAATRKRRHKKNAVSGATVENGQWHSGCSQVCEDPLVEKWLARSDADLEMAIASLAMILFTVPRFG